MNLSNTNNGIFLALSLILIPLFLISVTVLQAPEKKLKFLILKALSRKYKVKILHEHDLGIFHEYSWSNYFRTSNPERILVLKFSIGISSSKILKLIKDQLEKRKFKVVFTRIIEPDEIAISASRKSQNFYIGIKRGQYNRRTFLIRIES